MNVKRRFLISFVAYFAWIVLAIVLFGLALNELEAHPETPLARIPGWVGVLTYLVALMAPLPVLLYFFNRAPRWKKEVQKNGRLAPAQILAARDTGVSRGDSAAASFFVDLTLQVTPQGEAPFEAKLEAEVTRMSIPTPGDVIMVRYDPADHRHIAPARDLDTMPVVPRPAPDLSALVASMNRGQIGALTNQLHELEDMHRSGSLSDQEFRLAKKKLLA